MQQPFRDFWRNRFNINDDDDPRPAGDDRDGVDEACQILGVASDATEAEIQAAFRRRATETHPDRGGDAEAFRAVVEARDHLLRAGRNRSRPSASDDGANTGSRRGGPLAEAGPQTEQADQGAGTHHSGGPDRFSPQHPVSIVRAYLEWRGIRILFNGRFEFANAPQRAETRADVGAYLAVERLDDVRVLDDLLFECREAEIPLKKSDAQAALREEKAAAKDARKQEIINGLLMPLTELEAKQAASQWSRLVTVFDMEADFAVAVLQHSIHQVLSKSLGRRVDHHLTPVIFSAQQGTGKTTFAKAFLAPLEDLRSAPTPLSDIADPRSIRIFEFLAILVDDAGEISGSQVALLKSVLTDDEAVRRRLGTSGYAHFEQNATLFMTSNRNVSALVPDDTGHRRFVMMSFLNGNAANRGAAEIWETVNTIDYKLLWRSVDPFQPSPILLHLPKLAAHQEVGRADVLKAWLLDLKLNSDEVKAITTRHGLKAQALYDLFRMQTRSDISMRKFALELSYHIADPRVQLGPRDEVRGRRYYTVKKGAQAA